MTSKSSWSLTKVIFFGLEIDTIEMVVRILFRKSSAISCFVVSSFDYESPQETSGNLK